MKIPPVFAVAPFYIFCVLLFPCPVPASEVIVDWDGVRHGNYTSGGYKGQVLNTHSEDYWHRHRDFSMSSPLNPAGANTQPSERFYGGIDQLLEGEVRPGDNIRSEIQNIEGRTRSLNRLQSLETINPSKGHIRAAFVWNSEDFLNGGQPVTMGEGATFTLNVTSWSNGWLRFVVWEGDVFYVSDEVFSGQQEHVLIIVPGMLWHEWDPGAEDMRFDPETSEAVSLPLENVQGVGFTYQENDLDGQHSGKREARMFWDRFGVLVH